MSTHKSHHFPYVQAERHDEMSNGVPAPKHAEAGTERTVTGRWKQGAKTSQTLGGLSLRGKPKTSLSKAAKGLHRALRRELASGVGGGVCGVAASLFLRWAADKTELAEKAKEKGDLDTFRRLAESARMDILYAREHAAKAAEAEATRNPTAFDPLAKWRKP